MRPSGVPGLDIIDPIAWFEQPVPKRCWTVPDLIPARNVTMLAGDGGLGKSQIALQLLAAAALGRQWIARDVLPCKVFGVFCEDEAEELHRRLAQICRYYDADLSDLENMTLVSRVGLDNAMMSFESQWQAGEETPFASKVMNHALEFGAEIIVLDSLHDLFPGNENSRPQARQFINSLRSIATECNAAVVLTAHPSLTGRNTGTGESGSTAWNNACRSRLYLYRQEDETDPDMRYLKTMKANYGPSGEMIELTWADGVFVPRHHETGMIGSIERRNAETIFLEIARKVIAEGRNLSESKHSGNYAPKLFASRPERCGLKQHEFRAAMENLFAQGRLKVESYGREHDQHRRVAIVEDPQTEGDEDD